jgi:hypothetical protein
MLLQQNFMTMLPNPVGNLIQIAPHFGMVEIAENFEPLWER